MDRGFNETLLLFLKCPCCSQNSFTYKPGFFLKCNTPGCYGNEYPFELVNNQPLLIDFRKGLFKKQDFLNKKQGEVVVRKKGKLNTAIKRFLWGDSPESEKQIKKLISQLPKTDQQLNLLVVGGGTIGLGTEAIYNHALINTISFDVYITPHTQFVADAHNIPVRNQSIDAVVIQAVLEHVLIPAKVVEEIFRVLKPGGLVYAETPFMQQVHEGAYDFTRFTESGHRWLFKDFELIDSGAVRGAGVSLLWAIRYFFSGIFRSKAAGAFAAGCFFWLRFVEKLIPNKHNIDAGSCFYFLGAKTSTGLQEKEIIDFYNRQ